MAQGKRTSAQVKEECITRFQRGEDCDTLCREYGVSERTLYRWLAAYDGTRESLANKSSKPHSPHPKEMTPEEVRLMIEIVRENPHITNRELAEKIGTGRNPTSYSRKREKYFGKRKTAYKYDYATLFRREEIDALNATDAARGDIPSDFYAIEAYSGLYLRENDGHYPVCVTPYFSVALKFDTLREAEAFVQSLHVEDACAPNIRRVVGGKAQNGASR